MITRKTKLFGGLSLVLFIGAAIGVFLTWQYVQNKGDELLNQTKEIADFEAREQTYRDLERLVDDTQLDRDELRAHILTEDETIDFLATIEQIAIEQGVELTTDSLQVTEEKGLFDTLSIAYTIEGSKERVETMLLLLETLPYHAFISDLSLHFSLEEDLESAAGSIKLSISLLNYDR